MKRKLNPSWLRRLFNWWLPYLGSGIKVLEINDDWSYAKVMLKLRRRNANYFGTAYGGSLFSMTDPFYVLLLTNQLGRDYIVWDKSACIKFIRPGSTDVFAEFRLTPEQVAEIKAHADANDKFEPTFDVEVIDTKGDVVAKVEKRLYVRRKAPK